MGVEEECTVRKAVLSVNGLNKEIGDKQLLYNVNLTVYEGELFGLLGPNGSGKTTLIRSVLGLVKMNEGEISVNGYSIKTHFEEAMKHAGAIVENPEFYPFMTGYQNLCHFAYMHDNINEGRIKEAVSLVKLGQAIHDKVETYSLGMRQRLGVAQAILHKPKLLILDEPTNGLDPAGIRELRTYLKELCTKEGTAVVIASHLLKEVEDMCSRAAIIQDGEILAVQEIGSREGELLTVKFEVSDAIRAADLLNDYSAAAENSEIVLLAKREEIPVINKMLINEQIDVFAILPLSKSLEETFIELTGGMPDV